LREPEHRALELELERWPDRVSSMLLMTEAIRACARYGEVYADQARLDLQRLSLLPIDQPVIDRAATLPPVSLRSLDAIHLATALSLGNDLGILIAYDERLISAARDSGLPVAAPGSRAA
jgi:predicted nucleic acid-binding protein